MNILLYKEYEYKSKNGKMNQFKTMIGIYPDVQSARFMASKVEPKLLKGEQIGTEETNKPLYPINQKVREYAIQDN
tara:strand:- start:62 stop:289 length:228 start_codon:yes stop_codon:yes gene_type:complete